MVFTIAGGWRLGRVAVKREMIQLPCVCTTPGFVKVVRLLLDVGSSCNDSPPEAICTPSLVAAGNGSIAAEGLCLL